MTVVQLLTNAAMGSTKSINARNPACWRIAWLSRQQIPVAATEIPENDQQAPAPATVIVVTASNGPAYQTDVGSTSGLSAILLFLFCLTHLAVIFTPGNLLQVKVSWVGCEIVSLDCFVTMSTAVEPQNGHLVARAAAGGGMKKPAEGTLTPPPSTVR